MPAVLVILKYSELISKKFSARKGKAAMKRNRRNNARKERIIMIASSVFVLSALTMTGIYMKSNNVQEQDAQPYSWAY